MLCLQCVLKYTHMPDKDTLQTIAEKILKGTAAEAEKKIFWQHLEKGNEEAIKQQLFSEEVLQQLTERAVPPETEARILQSILQAPAQAPVVPLYPQASKKRWLRYGAAVACIAFIAGFFLSRTTSHKHADLAAVAWDSILNQQNTPRLITLPDRTTVWLNAQAVLYVNKNYTTNRLVQLKGEGYFEVAPQPQHPFRVQTGALTTTVLGTAFNIEAYAEEADIKISLVKGKVAVGDERDTMLLQPGYMAVFDKSIQAFHQAEIAAADISAWTHQKIVCNETRLPDVLSRLQRLYNVPLKYDSTKLSSYKITGEFTKGAIDEALDAVLAIHRIPYTWSGTAYYIGTKK